MFPLIGGLISGGLNLLGGMFSSDTSAQNTQATIQANRASQQESEQFNAQQAQLNRDFQAQQVQQAQEYNTGQVGQQEAFQRDMVNQQMQYETQMSNSAYQRAARDMKLAGINPILAAGGGVASTPSISAPSGSSASSPTASGSTASISPMKYDYSGRTSPLAGLGAAASQVVNSAIAAKTFDKMTEEISNIQADTARLGTQTTATEEQGRLLSAQRQKASKELPASDVVARNASSILNIPQWLFDLSTQGSYVGKKADDMLAPIVSGAGALKPWALNDRWYYK